MRTLLSPIKRIGPIRRLVLRNRLKAGIRGQSNEAAILRELTNKYDGPKTFVEFGFHPAEFNCSSLLDDHRGLLVDGSSQQVADGNLILPDTVECRQSFITLENMEWMAAHFPKVGVLSVDVDGNDYWFLERLITTNPTIICVEYNASFLDHSIATPYDPAFERHQKHISGWYHGASLNALCKLCAKHGYGLEAIAEAGGNAFFTHAGKLDPAVAWKPSKLRNEYAGCDSRAQWDRIAGLPFVEI